MTSILTCDWFKLWVPEGSRLRNNVEWVQENFPQQLRCVRNPKIGAS